MPASFFVYYPGGAGMKTHRHIVHGLLAMLGIAMTGVASAQTGVASLELRVQRVEDELAIRQVLIDYAATQDARDYAGYAALFARDGEWVNGKTVHKGREAIQKMLVGLYGHPPPGYVNNESFHMTSNPEVKLNGDRATVRSRHLLIMRGASGAPEPVLAGRYEDEFIREDGKWKILRRVDYPVMPTGEEWLKYIRERNANK